MWRGKVVFLALNNSKAMQKNIETQLNTNN